MKFVVNPGDWKDVLTFSNETYAIASWRMLGSEAMLYKYDGKAWWRTGFTGSWSAVERANLPVKVIEAGEK